MSNFSKTKLIFIFCLVICITGCSSNFLNITRENNQKKSEKFIIPQDYVGWVKVSYEVPNALPLPIEDRNLIHQIPETGFLETSSKKEQDASSTAKFFYNTENKLTEIKPSFWDGGGMIWGAYTEVSIQTNGWKTTGKANGGNFGFFVGTEKDFKEYGLKMEEKVGRITRNAQN